MHTVKTSFVTTERCEGVAFGAAAVLAPPGPLGVVTMGTFPLSLIAFGRISQQQSDDLIAARRASELSPIGGYFMPAGGPRLLNR